MISELIKASFFMIFSLCFENAKFINKTKTNLVATVKINIGRTAFLVYNIEKRIGRKYVDIFIFQPQNCAKNGSKNWSMRKIP